MGYQSREQTLGRTPPGDLIQNEAKEVHCRRKEGRTIEMSKKLIEFFVVTDGELKMARHASAVRYSKTAAVTHQRKSEKEFDVLGDLNRGKGLNPCKLSTTKNGVRIRCRREGEKIVCDEPGAPAPVVSL